MGSMKFIEIISISAINLIAIVIMIEPLTTPSKLVRISEAAQNILLCVVSAVGAVAILMLVKNFIGIAVPRWAFLICPIIVAVKAIIFAATHIKFEIKKDKKEN